MKTLPIYFTLLIPLLFLFSQANACFTKTSEVQLIVQVDTSQKGVGYSGDVLELRVSNFLISPKDKKEVCAIGIAATKELLENVAYVGLVTPGTNNPHQHVKSFDKNLYCKKSWSNDYPYSGDWSGWLIQSTNSEESSDRSAELLIRLEIPNEINKDSSKTTLRKLLNEITLGFGRFNEDLQRITPQGKQLIPLSEKSTQRVNIVYDKDKNNILSNPSSSQLPDGSFFYQDKQIVIYPNPATNRITIQLNSPMMEETTIAIFSMGGQEVTKMHLPKNNDTEKYFTMNISSLDMKSGVYFVKIQSGKKSRVTKVVVR